MHAISKGQVIVSVVAIVTAAFAGVVVGCSGSSEHPAAEGAEPTAPVATTESTATPTPTSNAEPCLPGSWRDCRVYWYDDRKQKHCTGSTQYCRPDGLDWQLCGAPPPPTQKSEE